MSQMLDMLLDRLPPSPTAAMGRWPVDRPLVMLHSGRYEPRWGRWSILAEPRGWFRCDHGSKSDPLRELDQTVRESADDSTGGWIGCFSYDLGRFIEPVAQHHESRELNWPLIELARCPGALVFDHVTNRWSVRGDSASVIDLLRAMTAAPADRALPAVSVLRSAWTPDEHLDAVRRTIEYIRAGDIFQANITQRFAATFAGSTRMLAAAAFETSQPLYGAYLELPDGRALVSMSPELFLHIGPHAQHNQIRVAATRQGSEAPRIGRSITTRPIKGTRPASTDPDELRISEKDAAELHMIVDLMRNDLGRVCEYGSVRVPVPRTIESHPTVHHGVSEITGTLRSGVTIADVLRATFPGGSITGAPKIRAMQIIDELEPLSRGPYCGSIGWLGGDGGAMLNIAIRTISLRGERAPGRFDRLDGELVYGAGGGIVADSDPVAEYRESLDKTAVLRQVIDATKRPNVQTSKRQQIAETTTESMALPADG